MLKDKSEILTLDDLMHKFNKKTNELQYTVPSVNKLSEESQMFFKTFNASTIALELTPDEETSKSELEYSLVDILTYAMCIIGTTNGIVITMYILKRLFKSVGRLIDKMLLKNTTAAIMFMITGAILILMVLYKEDQTASRELFKKCVRIKDLIKDILKEMYGFISEKTIDINNMSKNMVLVTFNAFEASVISVRALMKSLVLQNKTLKWGGVLFVLGLRLWIIA